MPKLQIDPQSPVGPELGRVTALLASGADFSIQAIPENPHDAVHRLRTTMKKLRSLLYLGRAELPDSMVSRALSSASWIKNAVTANRDREVLRKCLVRLAIEAETSLSGACNLREVETTLLPAVLPDIPAPTPALCKDLSGRMHTLRREIAALPFWVVTRRGLRDALERTHSKVLACFAKCRHNGSVEDFHDWRKAVKHQSAQCAILSGLFPRAARCARESEILGDALGTLNDYENLRDILDKAAPAAESAQALRRLLAKRLQAQRRHVIALGKKQPARPAC